MARVLTSVVDTIDFLNISRQIQHMCNCLYFRDGHCVAGSSLLHRDAKGSKVGPLVERYFTLDLICLHSNLLYIGYAIGDLRNTWAVLYIQPELREEERRSDIFSTMWVTYRSGFPRMEPYGYTDDSGWGCMLRSAQMLMSQALQRHSLGRHVIGTVL